MVAIIPNFASITGTVEAIARSEADQAFDLVTLQIAELKEHRDYPNLIRPLPRNRLQVLIKRSTREASGVAKGTRLSAIVRAAGGGRYYFVEDSIQIEP